MLTSTVVSLVLTWSCAAEQQRVRTHLEGAYTQLTTEEPAGLTPTQRSRRLQALAVLREYIDRGQFPKNPGLGLNPVFVDEDGTRCAMGEVIARLGGESLVEQVRQTRNLATVGVLADEPGLLEWLEAHGLTPEEAALVQPTYYRCSLERLQEVCGKWPTAWSGMSAGLACVGVDGGAVELLRLAGSEAPTTLNGRRGGWPEGSVYLWSRDAYDERHLVRRGRSFVARIDRLCGAAPTITEDEARELIRRPGDACMRALLSRDARWALVSCTEDLVSRERVRERGEDVCDPSGALRTGFVDDREAAKWVLQLEGLGDAGVDLSDYDRWLTEQPGPPALEPVTPKVPLERGCTVLPSTMAAWLIVLLLARRRR